MCRRKKQRGSSLAETAIMMPVFAFMIYGTVWVGEASYIGQRVHVASRYMAWSADVDNEDGATFGTGSMESKFADTRFNYSGGAAGYGSINAFSGTWTGSNSYDMEKADWSAIFRKSTGQTFSFGGSRAQNAAESCMNEFMRRHKSRVVMRYTPSAALGGNADMGMMEFTGPANDLDVEVSSEGYVDKRVVGYNARWLNFRMGLSLGNTDRRYLHHRYNDAIESVLGSQSIDWGYSHPISKIVDNGAQDFPDEGLIMSPPAPLDFTNTAATRKPMDWLLIWQGSGIVEGLF